MTWEDLFTRAAVYELSEDDVLAALRTVRGSNPESVDETDAETDTEPGGDDVD